MALLCWNSNLDLMPKIRRPRQWGLNLVLNACELRVFPKRHSSLCTFGYAIMLPGRKSDFRAGFRLNSNLKNLKIGAPAGRRATFEAFPQNPTKIRSGSPIFGPEELVRNIGHVAQHWCKAGRARSGSIAWRHGAKMARNSAEYSVNGFVSRHPSRASNK